MGKNKHSKIRVFLKSSCEAETQFPNDGISEFPYSKTRMGKHRQFHGNPCNHQSLGMCKFPYHGNILWKALSFPGCWFVRKLEIIRNFKQSPEHKFSKISYHENTKGKTIPILWDLTKN